MLLNKLTPAPGSIKKPKRIGRGQGSGHGGTSTRGLNGNQSRSGYKRKLGYEGGQNPLYRRLPKFGFTPRVNNDFNCVNIDTLEEMVKKFSINKVDLAVMAEHGLISNKKMPVKILGRGELKTAIELHAHAYSKSALEAISKSGGTANYIKK